MVRRAFLTLGLILFAIPSGLGQSDAFDLVISGAHVIDGSGNPWYLSDVGEIPRIP